MSYARGARKALQYLLDLCTDERRRRRWCSSRAPLRHAIACKYVPNLHDAQEQQALVTYCCVPCLSLPLLCRTVLQQLTPGPTHARCTYSFTSNRVAARGNLPIPLPVPRCVVRARHSSLGVPCCSSSDPARATGKTSPPRSIRVSPRDTSTSTPQLGSWHMTTTSS